MAWYEAPPPETSFEPPLPDALALDLNISDASIVLTVRVLESTATQPSVGALFALAIGAQRRLEHDEMDALVTYKGEEVRVKEKVRIESADPSLMAVMAKLTALEHSVGTARKCLEICMGGEGGDEGD